MPYVKQERRPDLDKVVEALAESEITKHSLEKFLRVFFWIVSEDYKAIEEKCYYISKHLKKAIYMALAVDVQPNGELNYILFKLVKYHITPSYNNYKDFMGCIYNVIEDVSPAMLNNSFKNELRESAEWIRIKILTPYEEKKILENGDI